MTLPPDPQAPLPDWIQSDDKADQPIQYSEDFRRSKRNTLVWAAAVVLLSIGTPQTEKAAKVSEIIEIGTLARNIAFSQPTLIVLAVVVLTFTFLGYWRANGRLKSFHAKFALVNRTADLSALAGMLDQKLRAGIEAVERTASHASSAADRMNSRFQALRNDLAVLVSDSHERLDTHVANALETLRYEAKGMGGDRFKYTELMVTAPKGIIASQSDELATSIRDALDRETGKLANDIETASGGLPEWRKGLEQQLRETASLAMELERFSGDLIRSERSWHRNYEEWTVWIAVAAAMVLAAFRLGAPETLEGWISPEAQTTTSAPVTADEPELPGRTIDPAPAGTQTLPAPVATGTPPT